MPKFKHTKIQDVETKNWKLIISTNKKKFMGITIKWKTNEIPKRNRIVWAYIEVPRRRWGWWKMADDDRTKIAVSYRLWQ